MRLCSINGLKINSPSRQMKENEEKENEILNL
jgi:hypothetical protein